MKSCAVFGECCAAARRRRHPRLPSPPPPALLRRGYEGCFGNGGQFEALCPAQLPVDMREGQQEKHRLCRSTHSPSAASSIGGMRHRRARGLERPCRRRAGGAVSQAAAIESLLLPGRKREYQPETEWGAHVAEGPSCGERMMLRNARRSKPLLASVSASSKSSADQNVGRSNQKDVETKL